LAEDVAILGRPAVVLRAAADATHANWFARLEDVAPDGRITMVTGAGLNGDQRDSSENPAELVPGRIYRLSFDLHLASWVFPKGHRIRLALSNALWPMTWPTPFRMTTSVDLGGVDPSRIELPRVPLRGMPAPHFESPAPVESPTDIKTGPSAW